MRLFASLALATIALSAGAHAAAADSTATSSIAQLLILEDGDKNWKNYHGALWLEYDKADYNYRWGGLQCKGRELSPSSIEILFAAFKSEYQVTLEYEVSEYKSKQYRCITGFTVSKS
jgi:hypothetical protein